MWPATSASLLPSQIPGTVVRIPKVFANYTHTLSVPLQVVPSKCRKPLRPSWPLGHQPWGMSRQRCHTTPRHHAFSWLSFQTFPEHWLCLWVMKTHKNYFLSSLSIRFSLYHQTIIINNNNYIHLVYILCWTLC